MSPVIPIWREAPFVRLLFPLIAGIIVQWYYSVTTWLFLIGIGFSLTGLLLFSFRNITSQYSKYRTYGILLNSLLFFIGILLIFIKDLSHHPHWIKRLYDDSTAIIARLEEPLSERANSFKAQASVQMLQAKNSFVRVKGNILLYFHKGDAVHTLSYGCRILFTKRLQPIQNTGNPGTFDYKQYCVFQQVFYQVYLKPNEYVILDPESGDRFKRFLFDVRKSLVHILRSNIPGARESGLAEALLIGYKDDLDKNLVQAYSNTGVIHIIAISGLHLGLIYWLLTQSLKFLTKRKGLQWLNPVLVIGGLWLFSLLAGASPSVLRSAVMFTCIILGENMSRKISVYNSLAASAFLLLCYNPFWLWDAGFQLSYAAVLSIVIFTKPVYNLIFTGNTVLDRLWKLNAVTMAAQILTFPISVYYFHQFPNFFLVTNLIAVPLSSVILIGELLLCAVFFMPAVSTIIGRGLDWLIRLMNTFIESIDRLPFAVLDQIQINFSQLVLLYMFILGLSAWMLRNIKYALHSALLSLLIFGMVRTFWVISASNQKKMIVYNVPNHQAIDFIDGRNYLFIGDSALRKEGFLQNFHLAPSRIVHRTRPCDSLDNISHDDFFYCFNNKKIVVIEKPLPVIALPNKIDMDIVIISKNPSIYIVNISKIFACKQIIVDASNPLWKIKLWKADCLRLNIPFYSVVEKGAFVMNMN